MRSITFPLKATPQNEVMLSLRERTAQLARAFSGSVLGRQWTQPHMIGLEAYSSVYQANPNAIMMHALQTDNKEWKDAGHGTFSAAREIEVEVLQMLADLHHIPQGWSGYLTSGGTEGNIYSLWIARNRFQERAGLGMRLPALLLPVSAHYSLYKALDLLGWPQGHILNECVKWIDIDADYRMDLCHLESHLESFSKRDDIPGIVVVGTAMTSDTGAMDPLPEVRRIIDKFSGEKPIHFHIDASMGGMFLPFAELPEGISSRLGPLKPDTITIDLHKLGIVAYPCSAVFVANGETDAIVRHVPYLSGGEDRTLIGSRPGSMGFSAWAVFHAMGFAGYQEMISRTVEIARFLRSHMEGRKWFDVVSPLWSNYVTVLINEALQEEHADDPMVNWKWAEEFSISPTRLLRSCKDITGSQYVSGNRVSDESCSMLAYKIVIMPHVQRSLIEHFLLELDKAERLSSL